MAGAGLLTVFSSVKTRILGSRGKLKIENVTFRLFYQFTAGIFFACSGLVTLNQLLGTAIRCIVPSELRAQAVNQYCFVTGTYTLPHLYEIPPNSENFFHFGVGPAVHQSQKKFHRWYQWVPFVLFFQGCVFILPHVLWKICENGRIKTYAEIKVLSDIQLKDKGLLEHDEDTFKAIQKSAGYIWISMSSSETVRYVIKYIVCEILNVVVVIAVFFFTNGFLNGEFISYGPEVWSFMTKGTIDQEDTIINPMNRVFPKVSKCDFNRFGPSGNIVREDALCILSINIINEKIFAVLWFWLVILTVLGLLNLIYRLFIWRFPPIRNWILKWRVPAHGREEASRVFKRLGYSESLYFKRLANNVNRERMSEIIYHLDRYFKAEEKSRQEKSIRTPKNV